MYILNLYFPFSHVLFRIVSACFLCPHEISDLVFVYTFYFLFQIPYIEYYSAMFEVLYCFTYISDRNLDSFRFLCCFLFHIFYTTALQMQYMCFFPSFVFSYSSRSEKNLFPFFPHFFHFLLSCLEYKIILSYYRVLSILKSAPHRGERQD